MVSAFRPWAPEIQRARAIYLTADGERTLALLDKARLHCTSPWPEPCDDAWGASRFLWCGNCLRRVR